MPIEFKLHEETYKNHQAKVQIHDNETPEWEARLACCLIEKWGLVAAMEDGEDSSGRAKLRKATPEELVREACDVAQLAVAAFRERGWVKLLPTLAEIDAFQATLAP